MNKSPLMTDSIEEEKPLYRSDFASRQWTSSAEILPNGIKFKFSNTPTARIGQIHPVISVVNDQPTLAYQTLSLSLSL